MYWPLSLYISIAQPFSLTFITLLLSVKGVFLTNYLEIVLGKAVVQVFKCHSLKAYLVVELLRLKFNRH